MYHVIEHDDDGDDDDDNDDEDDVDDDIDHQVVIQTPWGCSLKRLRIRWIYEGFIHLVNYHVNLRILGAHVAIFGFGGGEGME